MSEQHLQSQLDRVYRQVRMMLAPAVALTTDDKGPLLKIQTKIHGTPEIIDGLGLMQFYGFHANPLPGTDVMAMFVGGDRSNGILIASNHQDFRPRDYKPGEIGIYTDEGDTVTLNRDNQLNINSKKQVTVKGQDKVKLDTPLTEITKDVKAFGKIDASDGFFKNGVPVGGGSQGPAGPAGPQGPAGPTGATGPTGADGNTVLHGTVAPPNTIGVAGDFYINTTNEFIYGPKTATAWPTPGTSLIGPQGPIGLTGAQGPIGATGPAGSYQAGSGIAIDTGTTPPTISTAVPYAPLASPVFTGTPSLPTGTIGVTQAAAANNTTLATTAYVKSQNYLTGNQTITLSGDVTGSGSTSIASTVEQLQGRPMAATLPTINQVLQWSGSAWAPATISGAGTVTSITAGTGITLSPSTITGTGSVALTSPVLVANGGTGSITLGTNNVLIGNGTGALIQAAPGANGTILASNGVAAPTFRTLNTLLDILAGTAAQGQIWYRSASNWAPLAPGTAGRFLQTGGAGANPVWADAVTGGPYLPLAGGSVSGNIVLANAVALQGRKADNSVLYLAYVDASNNIQIGTSGATTCFIGYGGSCFASDGSLWAAANMILKNNRYIYGKNAAATTEYTVFGVGTDDRLKINLSGLGVNAGGIWTFAGDLVSTHVYPSADNTSACGYSPGHAWNQVGSYAWNTASDIKHKTDIELLPDCLDLVQRISPKRFRFNNAPEHDLHTTHWGFIAQEVGHVMQEAGHDFGGHIISTNEDTGEESQGLNFNDLVAVLWKACQELSARVAAMETKSLEARDGVIH